MTDYLNTPIFGAGLTIIVFFFSVYLGKRFKSPLLNPIFVSISLIIVFLTIFKIDYTIYNKGGSIIAFFLEPATVVLAVPLYRQINLLKENLIPILVGILAGSITGIISIIFLGKIFNLDSTLLLSLIPKNTTSPIAMDISTQIGGNPALSIGFVVVTGVGGYIIGEKILKTFKIKNEVAKGIALGATSHASGTAKAIELGEVEGAMASLAIGVAGLITVFLAPLIISIFNI